LPGAASVSPDKKSVMAALETVLDGNPALESYSKFAAELSSTSGDIAPRLVDSVKS
jgi:hypothetical protein